MRFPRDRYPIKINGSTISFAGNPNKNASRITPSIPMKRPSGSRKPAQCIRMVCSPTAIFAAHQIKSPAGAAAMIALPKTNKVRSSTERMITFPICGLRYGGSSNRNVEGSPFKIVPDKIFDTRNVIPIPRVITPVRSNASFQSETV